MERLLFSSVAMTVFVVSGIGLQAADMAVKVPCRPAFEWTEAAY